MTPWTGDPFAPPRPAPPSPGEVRHRGLLRVGAITTAAVLGGGAASLTVAVALAVSRAPHTVAQPATGGGSIGSRPGAGGSGRGYGGDDGREGGARRHPAIARLPRGGVNRGNAQPPVGQSLGS